jgi:hypothetical protein
LKYHEINTFCLNLWTQHTMSNPPTGVSPMENAITSLHNWSHWLCPYPFLLYTFTHCFTATPSKTVKTSHVIS